MGKKVIGIIGASIAGCASAILLKRAGYQIQAFEKRGPQEMKDLGSGIVLPGHLIDTLKKADLLDDDFDAFPLKERIFLRKDSQGKEVKIGIIPVNAYAINWGLLYHQLAKRLPLKEIKYHEKIINLKKEKNKIYLETKDQKSFSCDYVLCADGYRSIGRQALFPEVRTQFVDYTCWQGTYTSEDPEISNLLKKKIYYYVYEKGVLLIYEIPSERNKHSYSWFFYENVDKSHPFVRDKKVHVNIYKDHMTDEYIEYLHELAEKHLPVLGKTVIQKTQAPFTHAIYDTLVPEYYLDQIALIGDAGILLRPHLGSGATKALQDALRLYEFSRREKNLQKAFTEWGEECQKSAAHLFDLSRAFGEFLVSKQPCWSKLDNKTLNKKWDDIVEGYNWYQHE